MDYKDFQAGAIQESFWFKAKAQFIEVLLKKLNHTQNLKILDIGAGTGEDIASIKKFGQVHALDIDQKTLDLIPDYLVVEKKIGDACNLPYENQSFDLVVAFDVLEHIEQDQKVITEIHRVLKPNGHFAFTVPAYNTLYSNRDTILGHQRRYNKTHIQKLLKDFKKQTLGSWFFFLFLPAAFFLILPKKTQKKLTYDSGPSSFHQFPKILNDIFYTLLRCENWLISKRIKFPFGLTIYGIYKKER
ncbi:MAG: class I SAM-dependent methyltransferase [bacterium]